MFSAVLVFCSDHLYYGMEKTVFWDNYGCKIVGQARSVESGLELIRTEKPDVLFTGIHLPDKEGLRLIREVRKEFKEIEIVVVSELRDFDILLELMKLDVVSYLLLPTSLEEIEQACNVVCKRLFKGKPKKEIEIESIETSMAGRFVVRNALEYIRENYKRKLSLKEVADATYVSQWHLSKLLNHHLDHNFSELLNVIRIEEAKRLLTNPSLRIGDIAKQVGFSDLAHFSRVFRKMTGQSANEFRNRL